MGDLIVILTMYKIRNMKQINYWMQLVYFEIIRCLKWKNIALITIISALSACYPERKFFRMEGTEKALFYDNIKLNYLTEVLLQSLLIFVSLVSIYLIWSRIEMMFSIQDGIMIAQNISKKNLILSRCLAGIFEAFLYIGIELVFILLITFIFRNDIEGSVIVMYNMKLWSNVIVLYLTGMLLYILFENKIISLLPVLIYFYCQGVNDSLVLPLFYYFDNENNDGNSYNNLLSNTTPWPVIIIVFLIIISACCYLYCRKDEIVKENS